MDEFRGSTPMFEELVRSGNWGRTFKAGRVRLASTC